MIGQRANSAVVAIAALLGCAAGSSASVYTDATGDLAAPNFDIHPHLDISSVSVTDDGTSLTFTINTVGNINAAAGGTDWGKYCIGFDTGAGGDTASNPWGRSLKMSSGMDAWVGSWVDGGGGRQVWRFTGGAWAQQSQTAVTLANNSTMFTVPWTEIGLAPGSAFQFDVYSTGGGGTDTAVDASANPSFTVNGWSDVYDSGSVLSTFPAPAPEPASLGVLGLMGVAAVARRRRHA